MKNKFLNTLTIAGIVVFIFISFIVAAANQSRQARFTVDVLEEFLRARQVLGYPPVERLSELPDFYLVSPYDSLSLKAADLKQGIKGGYVYDFQYFPDGKFVISASPVGLLPFRPEFSITEKGVLRMNNKNVDVEADNYEEVENWPILTRNERVHSNDAPKYSL